MRVSKHGTMLQSMKTVEAAWHRNYTTDRWDKVNVMLSRARHKIIWNSDITTTLFLALDLIWVCTVNVVCRHRSVRWYIGLKNKSFRLRYAMTCQPFRHAFGFKTTHNTGPQQLNCLALQIYLLISHTKAAYNPWRDLNHFVSALSRCVSQKLMNFRERGRSVKNRYFSEITRKILCVLTE
jgi:hypothetical protein